MLVIMLVGGSSLVYAINDANAISGKEIKPSILVTSNNVINAPEIDGYRFVGVIEIVYQIYHITVTDANARGLKHPKLWGLLAMNGNNSSGLILYLITRRNYPFVNLTSDAQSEIERRKKAAGIGLLFPVTGAIGFVLSAMTFI